MRAQMRRTDVPSAADLLHLRPDDVRGAATVTFVVLVTLAGGWLSMNAGWIAWATGQLLLALALVQWFVLLHECGHATLFRTSRCHGIVGWIAGFMTMIPFRSWTRVHAKHHKWTGWQDLDPTTEGLVPRELSRAERLLVNTCWRLWIPLFSILYRVTNFWNVPRLLALFPSPNDKRAIFRQTSILIVAYGCTIAFAGPMALIRLSAAALILSFVFEDVLLLSQHTHIPQNISDGRPVRPFPPMHQEVFTRSLRLPSWLSLLLLHFDAHELHHMYPFVPGYHLRSVAYRPSNEIGWWRWVRGAKHLRGDVLLFANRTESGFDL
jgi:omega-6 fatty acid desaturase (delta-12 desaturase)